LAQTFLSAHLTQWRAETDEKEFNSELYLTRILGLLGKVPVRNLLACARQQELLTPEKGLEEDEKIVVVPTQFLPFALEAEKLCQDNHWLAPEHAFSAGLHYDWLFGIIKRSKGSPEVRSTLSSAFKEGLKIGKSAYQLGQHLKDFEHGKFLFAAGLLLPIGNTLMASLYPKGGQPQSWSQFSRFCNQAGDSTYDCFRFLEKRKFAVTHSELSCWIASFGMVLSNLEKALFFYQDPERLKSIDYGLYQLAMALSLAVRMTRANGKKFPLEPFQTAWMTENKINEALLWTGATA
jgi:hypothetical protein